MSVLPRLLYIGDVPIESSFHGSTLLFRLLQNYPSERLHIVEGNLFAAHTGRRLPGVRYSTLRVGRSRLLNSRFHDRYSHWLMGGGARRVRRIPELIAGFTPDAVLTVAHGYSWVTAAHFAQQSHLPLHLIVQDDWPRVVAAKRQVSIDEELRSVYRAAVSRLCASPFMVEEYQRRYGVDGTLLLPSRASDAPLFDGVAERLERATSALVYAFAGTVNTPGYARLLRQLAAIIAPDHGRLLIFGPLTTDQATASGLDAGNIELRGLLPAGALLGRLREDADVLFVPMSFAPQDRANMRMGFPAKLTDYTAVGLPLLICGPPDCSAVTWAARNPGVAEAIATDDDRAVAAAVDRLTSAPYRRGLARKAQEVGQRDFSPSTAHAILYRSLTGGPPA